MEDGFPELAEVTAYNALTKAKKDLLKDNRKKNFKAHFYIFQAAHESIFLRVVITTKSNETWDILQTAYQGMVKVKIIKL